MSFENQLVAGLHENQIALDKSTIDQLVAYFYLTEKWAKKINVTANTAPENYILENIIDPILAFQSLKSLNISEFSPGTRLADFGCGGGFVGITWQILLASQTRLILVDSDRKKINFCRDVCRRLKVQHVDFITNRCELLIETHENQLDLIVSRATFSDETEAINSAAKLLKDGGSLLLLKGSGIEQDLSQRPDVQTKNLGTPKTLVTNYLIRPSMAKRFVKVIDKHTS